LGRQRPSPIFFLLPVCGAFHHFRHRAQDPRRRDKIGVSIHKILEEDAALRFMRDPQTKEFLLAGSAASTSRWSSPSCHKRYHVDLTLKPPKVPTQTIRGKGRRGRQAQEHPAARPVRRLSHQDGNPSNAARASNSSTTFRRRHSAELDSVRGKGYSRRRRSWLSRGFPVVDFSRRALRRKYHDVDSSDMAFKIAGSLAFKEAMKQARPALLEPVMHVECMRPINIPGT